MFAKTVCLLNMSLSFFWQHLIFAISKRHQNWNLLEFCVIRKQAIVVIPLLALAYQRQRRKTNKQIKGVCVSPTKIIGNCNLKQPEKDETTERRGHINATQNFTQNVWLGKQDYPFRSSIGLEITLNYLPTKDTCLFALWQFHLLEFVSQRLTRQQWLWRHSDSVGCFHWIEN